MRVLAIGTTRASVPLPQFGVGCTLWLAPTDCFVVGAAPLVLSIPPTLPPLTFMAQGAAVVADSFAPVPLDTTLTAGYAVTLQ